MAANWRTNKILVHLFLLFSAALSRVTLLNMVDQRQNIRTEM